MQTSSAPKRRAAVCWPACLATADQRGARRGLAHGGEREQPDRAGADDRDVLARLDVGDRARRAARRRAARPARRPRRTGRPGTVCSCDSWRDEALAPAAAGVAAEAGLQAGARGRRRSCGGTARAGPARTRGTAARPRTRAAERGLDDDALAACAGRRRSRPRSRGRGRTACWSASRGAARPCRRAAPGRSRRCRSAAGGSAASPGPGARGGRISSSASAPAPGRPARVGDVLGDARRVGQRLHQTAARSVVQVSIGQRRRRASRESRKSGLIACGWPTSSSSGRSPRLSP